MNRKQRRAQSLPRATGAPQIEALYAAAVQDHAAGNLGDAEQLYRRILAIDPRHAVSLHRLGVIAYQVGQWAVAVDLIGKAIAVDRSVAAFHAHLSLALAGAGRLEDAAQAGAGAVALAPDAADAHANLALILLQLGRAEEAAEHARRAASLAPELPDAHNNLGGTLQELGRSCEAADCYRRALALEPDFAEAHTGLGNALLDLGDAREAAAHHQRAIALRPDYPQAHHNLGQSLRRLGLIDEAADAFRAAVAIDPSLTVAYCNLARMLKTCGRLPEAEATLRQALATSGDDAALLNELALTLLAQGDQGEATRAIIKALALRETPAVRRTFVDCVNTLDVNSGAEALRPLVVRALREGWARPEGIARVGIAIVKQEAAVAAGIAHAAAAWPGPVSEALVFGNEDIAAVAGSELLQALLCVTPNADFSIEKLLTLARRALLDDATAGRASEAALNFHAALARQCFLNEYVFHLADVERRQAEYLRDRLVDAVAAGEEVAATTVLAVACYFSLATLPLVERLVERRWPPAVAAVLTQQIVEVREEDALMADIPQLTPIRDGGSLDVQAQYEASPYPRWLDAGAGEPPQPLADYLAARFPLAGLRPVGGVPAPDILVAGCGTGRNALDTARAFAGSRVLAIDLSRASLAHALRKTREAGVANITYVQADLLEIGALGRDFDLIEAVGVLHHLADPLAGWRALLAKLRPGGVMRLGFYSAAARQHLPQVDVGEPTADAIRVARQSLAERSDEPAREALRAPDFYSVSGCRDLLFHVQEHRLTLGEIDAFLRTEGLTLLGFDILDAALTAYRARFPHDPAARDLRCWNAFERDNPDTFAAMYQFWVQKAWCPI